MTIPTDKNDIVFNIGTGSLPKAEAITMNNPKITFDENLMDIVTASELKSGGEISAIPKKLTILFACKEHQKGKSQISVTLTFTNHDVLSFSFFKECDTISAIENYFSVIYFLYWLLLITIFSFIIVLTIFYLKRENISATELSKRILDGIISKLVDYKGFVERKYNYYRHGVSENNNSYSNKDHDLHLNTLNNTHTGENFVMDVSDSEVSYNQEKQKDSSNNYYGGI